MELTRDLKTIGRSLRLAAQVLKGRLAAASHARTDPLAQSRFVGFEGFGANPGKLRMLAHVPLSGAGRPLVVLLHGCGQDAATFADDSGWTGLAERLGIPLILPQQAEANNASRCFQWFHPRDIARGQGEAGSIAAMTRAAADRFGSDPKQVFVVGLSAGGAMAAALLAAYPDLYAGGAVIAGLPVGAARSGMQALLRMASPGLDVPPETWAASVRQAAPAGFDGRWPSLSIWQGEADKTVAPGNAALLADQWRALLGLPRQPEDAQASGGVRRQAWKSGQRQALEVWSLANVSHGYPVRGAGAPNRFVLPAPVDATAAIARFFGLD